MRKSKAADARPQSHDLLDEQIAQKAYELYEQRGGGHGYDLDDWLAAERSIREEASQIGAPSKTKGKVVSMRRKKASS